MSNLTDNRRTETEQTQYPIKRQQSMNHSKKMVGESSPSHQEVVEISFMHSQGRNGPETSTRQQTLHLDDHFEDIKQSHVKET